METPKPSNSNDILLRLLSASELRARVISANIANQNTPGYTRQEVRFEDALREAVASGSKLKGLQPEIIQDTITPARPDGNNVNLELELNALRENRILFETYATIMQGRTTLKDIAVSGGR